MKVAYLALTNLFFKVESLKVLLGALLLFASGQIAIPLEPVPITMTTVGVMLIGLLYQRHTALLAVMTYISAGAAGLPVFQGFTGGIVQITGPTAGYIFGFALAVLVMTLLREKFKLNSFFGMLLNCSIGTLIIFIPGVAWLSVLIGFDNAIKFGVLPFILPGIGKAVLLTIALKIVRPRAKADVR
ncbi:MAG TPA: biotin transporter BioY [Myxococcota bacterium]|nr:biotin transporter BioY [Myxococcota bacterium]